MTAIWLRDMAREAMLRAGGRGFMRFAPEGGALLATDAIRRCADDTQAGALIKALEACGFDCAVQDGLLLLTPCDALIAQMGEGKGAPRIEWESPLHPAASLAARWMRLPAQQLTDAGRRLVIDALRLTGTPGGRVLEGLDALRAHAAAMLRSGDRGGLREAGAILSDWCEKEERA